MLRLDVQSIGLDGHSLLTRRRLIQAFGAVGLGVLLSGCGGGGGPEPYVPAQLRLGAPFDPKDTRIETLLSEKPVVPKGDGAFFVTLLADMANLVYATDTAGRVKGLAIVVPNAQEATVVDALSTAVALTMLAPGILAIEPSAARNRAASLSAMAGVRALAAFLVDFLKTGTLEEAAQSSLLDAAIQEVATSFGLNAAPPSRNDWLATDIYNGVRVWHPTWRGVRVSREGQTASGSPTIPGDLGYALSLPSDWDELFQPHASPRPESLHDRPDVRTTNTARLTYRAYGPGVESPPFQGDVGAVDLSAFALVYLPIALVAAGNSTLARLGSQAIVDLWASLAPATEAPDLRSALEGNANGEAALLAIVRERFDQSHSIFTVANVAWPQPVTTARAATFVRKLQPLLTAAHVRIAASYWPRLRSFDDASFAVSSGVIVID